MKIILTDSGTARFWWVDTVAGLTVTRSAGRRLELFDAVWKEIRSKPDLLVTNQKSNYSPVTLTRNLDLGRRNE